MNEDQKCKILSFMKYLEENNVTVCFADFDKTLQAISVSAFNSVLQRFMGKEYACLLKSDEYGHSIVIYNDSAKEYLGELFGTVEYAYERGDTHESPLSIIYAVLDNTVYIGGETAGYIFNAEQISYTRDGLYLIDNSSGDLKKYNEGKLIWTEPIPADYTQMYKFDATLDYLNENYPHALIAISNRSRIYHFFRENGRIFGRTEIEERYSISQSRGDRC
jgi:hypothetical protein